ncbi:hypothetical protein BRSU_0423 [Brachyspira suanatina]|uniref:Lipoprotein n=1 Tax=Brachyspira suanatina TaxID=381802 RepID=A0A0G4K454_9SPIR|nr:hypothetical protein [Brachyspira suanatina]CRF31861.1 hypothetical protein BRSU_0423 [Brachyspira suanatina]
MKKLFLFTLLVSTFLVISCNYKLITPEVKEYKANGISSIYENIGYKFFSMDGETYTITIKDGGIIGLQQSGVKSDLTKSDIYSVNAEGDIIESLGNDARVYLIYNNELQGSIIFPTDVNGRKGGVNITKSDGSTIEGIIRTDLQENHKIPKDWYADWESMNVSGLSYFLTINSKTITSYSDVYSKLIIPTSFFEADGNTYYVFGNYYNGTSISMDTDGKLKLVRYDKETAIKFNPKIEGGKITGYTDDSIIPKEEVVTPLLSKK